MRKNKMAKTKLNPDEKIFYTMHPHSRVLLKPVIIWLLTCFIYGFLDETTGGFNNSAILMMILKYLIFAILLASLGWLLYSVFRWLTTKITLTEYRVTFTKGLLFKKGFTLGLDKVTDYVVVKDFIKKIFKTGDIVFNTTGGDKYKIFNLARLNEFTAFLQDLGF